MALSTAITMNRFLLQYCSRLTADIGDDRLTEQPLPQVNHPAWILGHLAYSAEQGVGLLGGDKRLPAEWTTRFGPGSKPTPNRADYPPREELLREVEQCFERFRQQVASASQEQLSQPSTNPFTKDALPTIEDSVAFLLTGHLAVHLGQLSTWRRMTGSQPLF